MNLLMITQLSNYDTHGKFILEADSGWQMCINRARAMLKLDPELIIDITGPRVYQLKTPPDEINHDVFDTGRVKYVSMNVVPHALSTRYDFHIEQYALDLSLEHHKSNPKLRYDAVYVNDPQLLRHYRALFFVKGGYMPKFFVHSHFVDIPSNPKFPVETSLWLGQCEAAIKADYNFWQCQSAMDEFFEGMSKTFLPEVVEAVRVKSSPYDDGYSIEEITSPVNLSNVRFDLVKFRALIENKTIIFVPNRVGGMGRSSDYTNCGKFLFEVLPELARLRPQQDYVVIAGNPSQKFSNQELEELCGKYGFVNLVPDAFTRDEYKFITSQDRGDIAVGLYNADTFGGTASRECVENGMIPFWCDNYEYTKIAMQVGNQYTYQWNEFLCKPDLSDAAEKLNNLLNVASFDRSLITEEYKLVVRKQSSFEETTPEAYSLINMICNSTTLKCEKT